MKGILIHNGSVVIEPVRAANGLIMSGVVIGNIDYQRCGLILEMQKGELKEFPTLGFGVDNYLKNITEKTKQLFITELKKELKSDGIVATVTIGDDLTEIEIEL